MQSAAILIVGKGQGVWLNNDVVMRLQVDDSPEPIKELRRLVEGWNERKQKGQQRPVGYDSGQRRALQRERRTSRLRRAAARRRTAR